MRIWFVPTLGLLASCSLGCGGSGPFPQPFGTAAKPGDLTPPSAAVDRSLVPQDPARAAVLRAAAREWYRGTTVGAFEAAGGGKAAWADKARHAMEVRSAELSAFDLCGVTDHAAREEADVAVRAAVAAGCDDPLILYWKYTLDVALGRVGEQATMAEHRVVVRRLADSRYPAVRKLHALYNLGLAIDDAGPQSPFRAEKADWERWFWEVFDAVARERGPFVEADLIYAAVGWGQPGPGTMTAEARYDRVAGRLTRAGVSKYAQLTVRGTVLIKQAWAARGNGVASTVTAERFDVFHDRIEEARQALEAAHEADPTRWEAPTAMITVCTGLSADRAETDKWFRRAMAANPDNAPACQAMLNYLAPKWHGTTDEYLAFGRSLAATGNTAGHLPFVPIRFYLTQQAVVGDRYERNRASPRAFYTHPTVWETAHEGLGSLLAAKPNDRYYRSLYARLAALTGRYEVAHREFETLGTGYDREWFPDEAEYRHLRTEVELGARQIAARR